MIRPKWMCRKKKNVGYRVAMISLLTNGHTVNGTVVLVSVRGKDAASVPKARHDSASHTEEDVAALSLDVTRVHEINSSAPPMVEGSAASIQVDAPSPQSEEVTFAQLMGVVSDVTFLDVTSRPSQVPSIA